MATDQEKHDYLISWYWKTEQHSAGFLVYFHDRFPDVKYRLNAAYEKMKANEPSAEPVFTVQTDDTKVAEKIREFFENNGISLPPPGKRKSQGLIHQVFGDPV